MENEFLSNKTRFQLKWKQINHFWFCIVQSTVFAGNVCVCVCALCAVSAVCAVSRTPVVTKHIDQNLFDRIVAQVFCFDCIVCEKSNYFSVQRL